MKCWSKQRSLKIISGLLVVLMSWTSIAEAKSSGSGFKRGFSSQRVSRTQPAKVLPAKTNTASFGSFGQSGAAQQTAPKVQSKLGKDLSASAAQANAQKTLDARNGATATMGSQGNGWSNKTEQLPHTPTVNPPPMIYQTHVHQSNGLMHGLMWFMIGRSMSESNKDYGTTYNQWNYQENTDWDGQHSNNANGFAGPQVQDVPVAETESFFMKMVRFLLWLGLLSGMYFLVKKIWKFKQRKQKVTNYSLGS